MWSQVVVPKTRPQTSEQRHRSTSVQGKYQTAKLNKCQGRKVNKMLIYLRERLSSGSALSAGVKASHRRVFSLPEARPHFRQTADQDE